MFLFTSRPRTLDVMFLMGNKFPPTKLLNVLLRTYLDLGPPVPLGNKKSFFAVTIEPARAPCQLTPISSRSSLIEKYFAHYCSGLGPVTYLY